MRNNVVRIIKCLLWFFIKILISIRSYWIL